MKKLLIFFFLILFELTLTAQIVNLLPAPDTNEIINHKYYTVSFSKFDKEPEWVAYLLVKPMLTGESKRKNNFRIDPLVETGTAKPSDYAKSGYDKGHLCPADDMTFNDDAMSETFYMSNMSPQLPSFNRGIWKTLETFTRNFALNGDSLYIISGGILTNTRGSIGFDKVTVPNYYYKVIYDMSKPKKMIAFILPNETGTKPLEDYTVSVDSVEKVTHIHFFPSLSDTLKSSFKINDWFK